MVVFRCVECQITAQKSISTSAAQCLNRTMGVYKKGLCWRYNCQNEKPYEAAPEKTFPRGILAKRGKWSHNLVSMRRFSTTLIKCRTMAS